MTPSTFEKFLSELRLSGVQLSANQISQYNGKVYGLNLHGLEGDEYAKFPFGSPYLHGIERLHLPKHQIQKYPDIFHLDTLTHLCLSSHSAGNLPEIFYQLVRLKVLNLAANEITHFSDKLGNLTHLQCFALGSNKLQELPDIFENLKNLRYLNLFNNELKSIPGSIGKLKSLDVLRIHNNKIEDIPYEIMDLGELDEFKFHDNPVEKNMSPANYLWLEILEQRGCKLRRNDLLDGDNCYEFDIIPPR